ncbi:hypothetical protein IPM65_03805 [Candidatus Roizmanbacteria bacterium]|nr:MAG: hypothetical protein IPM65_03805 [Candidatus Roizmanbacteria bacterium]
MKITVYTINDCKFSQAEKEYLKKNNVEFEEKNLETNRDFLTEMLAVSNNFAGTPVTKIEKDSGEPIVLKGFTQEEFDKALGLAPVSAQPVQTAAVAASSTAVNADAAPQPEEAKQENTSQPADAPAPVDSQPAAQAPEPAPIAVESLSQDDSTVTPSADMPVAQPVEPITPAAPASNDSIGPISLSGDQQPSAAPAPQTEQTPVAEASAVQSPDASVVQPSQQQPAAPQPASDALNSVLQNLQNQVNSTPPGQDGQKQ